MIPVSLLGMATAVPPHVLHQDEVAARAQEIFSSRVAGYDHLARVFASTGIRRRHAARPIDWYSTAGGWPERNRAYVEAGTALFEDAARAALARAGCRAQDVDAVVTVSSTGIATPSLEARCAGALGLRSDVNRVPVFGLGCAGGVGGLALAARLARATPGSTVLLVCLELCTLAFRGDQTSKANIVATSLFGDGAAASVVRATTTPQAGRPVIGGAGEHQWPDTLGIMGWDVEDEGLGVVFDRAIPPFAEANLGPAVDSILARMDLRRTDIDRFVCHPGGAKVVTALERALRLPEDSLADERAVLADYGNMSAPTVFFVLERQLATASAGRRLAMLAMGPGFTASLAVLETR